MKQRNIFGAITIMIALFYSSFSFSQTRKRERKKDTESTEVMPVFTYQKKSGEKAFLEFIVENIKYPDSLKKKRIEGIVYAQYIIEENGTIDSVKILKSVHPACDSEVIRVLKESGKYWSPATKDGRPVRVMYTAPVRFRSHF